MLLRSRRKNRPSCNSRNKWLLVPEKREKKACARSKTRKWRSQRKKKRLHSTTEDVKSSSEKPQTRVGSPQNDAVRRQRKHRSREERARTQGHQARRGGERERDTLLHSLPIFPIQRFWSNEVTIWRSVSYPGSRAFDCRQGRWTLTHFSHGSCCQQSSIPAVANPVVNGSDQSCNRTPLTLIDA